MSQQFNVAVLGATGLVGKQIIELLAKRDFPVAQLFPLASERSAGQFVDFEDQQLEVVDAENFDWAQVDIAFFSAGGTVSKQYAPLAADAGCIVIDNTSEFRYQPDIPLVVPEVNADALLEFRNRNIIANPNCSTIQLVLALKPIHDAVGIERVIISTYQSVSGAGNAAVEELAKQCSSLLNGRPVETNVFNRQIAFNCIPQIDQFMDNGFTKEEMKLVWESQKILGLPDLKVNATCVRVPVFYGHGESVYIETAQPIDEQQAIEMLTTAPGVKVYEQQQDFPTQIGNASGNDWVHIGRLRQDLTNSCGLNFWIVADNVRKGAATNSIQIAEKLIAKYW